MKLFILSVVIPLFSVSAHGQIPQSGQTTNGDCAAIFNGNGNTNICNVTPNQAKLFGFSEGLPEQVTVLISNDSNIKMSMNIGTSVLKKGPFDGLLVVGNHRPLSVYIEDNVFYVDATITDGTGSDTVKIHKNVIDIKPPQWDRNFSQNAIEVVDANQHPIFQMIRKRANVIQIAGLFATSGAVFDASPTKTLFKYPAWKYPGQYADENTPPQKVKLLGLPMTGHLGQGEFLTMYINLQNVSGSTIRERNAGLVAIAKPLTNSQDEIKMQDELWNALLQKLEVEGTYNELTIGGDGMRNGPVKFGPISAEQAADIANGYDVYFLAVMEDLDTKTNLIEVCGSVTARDSQLSMCHSHNKP